MTNKEAVEVIKSNIPTSGYYELREALSIALNSLEKTINEDDRMSYEEAINAVKTWFLPMRKTCEWGGMANEFLDGVEVLLKHATKS